MNLSIEEQKQFLFKRLRMESLTMQDMNKESIKKFVQATQGCEIQNYLLQKAWNDDVDRNTKVFLIKDTELNQICFYFAINCGILFSDFTQYKIKDNEKDLYDTYLEAAKNLNESKNLCEEERKKVEEEYNNVLNALYFSDIEADRVSQIINHVNDMISFKNQKKEFTEKRDESEWVQLVKETFPAIDIKFLCRNKNYKVPIDLDFKLGVYVFWEMIVPHLLDIAEMVGCKYIYLFAADNSDSCNEPADIQEYPMYSDMYLDDDDDITKSNDLQMNHNEIYKLVNYYINELKFSYVANYKILKPNYERTCFTLIQEVKDLQNNRMKIWHSHEENYNQLDA